MTCVFFSCGNDKIGFSLDATILWHLLIPHVGTLNIIANVSRSVRRYAPRRKAPLPTILIVSSWSDRGQVLILEGFRCRRKEGFRVRWQRSPRSVPIYAKGNDHHDPSTRKEMTILKGNSYLILRSYILNIY